MAADWSVEVIEAVERWAALTPERGTERAWRCVGPALAHRDGWLILDLRNGRGGPESLVDPCLAGERGPDDGPSYPIDERRNADGVLMLRAPAGWPGNRRFVWARSMSSRFLVKLFGVGITRARSRLYVVVDWEGVRSAPAGPFRALRAAVERGEVRRWSAAALLGRAEPPTEPADSTFVEVARLLERTVTVTDIHDERSFVAELERQLGGARAAVWRWSPWIANRARQVVPLIKAAVDRGVQVTVFIRPDEDRNMSTEWAQRRLPELRDSGATVIRSDHEHRKLVIIDAERVLIGSANVLSHSPGSTREIMVTMEGRGFAGRLIAELRVDEIARPRACPACSRHMELRRSGGRRCGLFWHCRPCNRRIVPP